MLALFGPRGPAVGQTSPDQKAQIASNAPKQGLEEIVVTAQKRAENLQSVPISVTALSSQQLQREHIRDYDDLTSAVPGLSFGSGGSEGLTNIEIRGVSSTSGSATVGLYLDDTSITTKNFYDGAAQPKLFDIDRVEVLRGPQGTLYGASSLGGTIRFVTPQPDMNKTFAIFSQDISGTEHGGFNFIDTAIFNTPIVADKIALRASLGYSKDSGYIDSYAPDGASLLRNGVNHEEALSAHATIKWKVNDGLTITPSVFYRKDDTGDNSAFYPSLGLWKQDKEVVEYGHDQLFIPGVAAEQDLGFADLTSVSSFFWRQYYRQQDGTFYNSYAFANYFLDPIYPNYATVNAARIQNLASPIKYMTNYGQGSQELRLSSKPEAETGLPFTWVGGLYFVDQYDHHTNFQQIPGINSTFQEIYGYSINSPQSRVFQIHALPGVTQPFPNDVDEADESGYQERQYAIFGQIDYDIRPTLHASTGARYSIADVNYHFQTYGFYQIGSSPILHRIEVGPERPLVIYRRSGDATILVEYGDPVLDLELRLRVHALMQFVQAADLPGLIDITPGIRSLQLHFSPAKLSMQRLLQMLIEAEENLPCPDETQVSSRIVHLPLCWDDPATRVAIARYMQGVRADAPWCPSNIEFIRRINGLDCADDVKRIVFAASYLVLGLGDDYLGAPVATPIDPRHRLVTTKYNPARTWTPENAVGIGGAYLCIYGMEGPGGYQFVGRTCQVWNSFRATKDFEVGKPWLLRFFDQIRFYEVSESELQTFRTDFAHGAVELEIEETVFALRDYRAFLSENAETISAWKFRQQQAFEAERARWANMEHEIIAPADEAPGDGQLPLELGEIAVVSPVSGSIWRIPFADGDIVESGDLLVCVESMKTEIAVIAPSSGTIICLPYAEGRTVGAGQTICILRVLTEQVK